MIKTYKFRTNPVEAVQWTGDNLEEIEAFVGPSSQMTTFESHGKTTIWLESPVIGAFPVKLHDYIYRDGWKGLMTMSADEFERAYEEVFP